MVWLRCDLDQLKVLSGLVLIDLDTVEICLCNACFVCAPFTLQASANSLLTLGISPEKKSGVDGAEVFLGSFGEHFQIKICAGTKTAVDGTGKKTVPSTFKVV